MWVGNVRIWFTKLALFLVVVSLILFMYVFVLENTTLVSLSFVGLQTSQMSLSTLVTVIFLVGFVFGAGVSLLTQLKVLHLSSKLKQKENELKKLKANIA